MISLQWQLFDDSSNFRVTEIGINSIHFLLITTGSNHYHENITHG